MSRVLGDLQSHISVIKFEIEGIHETRVLCDLCRICEKLRRTHWKQVELVCSFNKSERAPLRTSVGTADTDLQLPLAGCTLPPSFPQRAQLELLNTMSFSQA